MKASNIYQTLKTKGYATDGTKPTLPGVGSPLNKVKTATTKLKNDPVKKPTAKEEKYSMYGYEKEVVRPISTSYNSKTGELTNVFSDTDVEKHPGIKKVQVTKASEKPPTTKAKVKSPASMNSPAKKKSCGSPARMEIGAEAEIPLDVAARPNPKRAMRKAKRRANRGTKAAVKKFKACKRSIGKGRGNKI